jgi:hypothetical protein
VLNRLVCRCGEKIVMANEIIAGSGVLKKKILVILNELRIKCKNFKD